MKIKEFFGKTGILGALIGMAIIIVGFLFLLNVFFVTYTMHGQTVTVPNIEGLSLKEAKNKLNNAGLEFMIADSTYKNDLPPGQILDQSPKKGATVKKFRKIYLTVSSVSAEPIKMPNLIDNSRRQAIIILESYGLKLGKENYVPDIAKNAVRGMYINGKEIKEGSIVFKGSVIDLDLGDGIGDTKVDVPDLLGATLMEALAVLDAFGLQPGIISGQGTISDSLNAFIYYQQPEFGTAYKLAPGDPVNLFIMQDQPDLETIQDIGAVDKSEIEEINKNQKKESNKQ